MSWVSLASAPRRGARALSRLARHARSRRGASSSAPAPGDPEALAAEMIAFARTSRREGRRDAAVGVLEHAADLVARAAAGAGDPAAALPATLAVARARLAWAAMQTVRRQSARPAPSPPLLARLLSSSEKKRSCASDSPSPSARSLPLTPPTSPRYSPRFYDL